MNGFGSIFWGFLFMFDFRIQGVDILPNFIGYLFMFLGWGICLHIILNLVTRKNTRYRWWFYRYLAYTKFRTRLGK